MTRLNNAGRLVCAAALAFGLASPARAYQRPGDPAPANHPSRAVLARPVYTSAALARGTWSTEEINGENLRLSGAPLAYEIAITDTEVAISSADDLYGPRVFGVVSARAVETWVEYDLMGQGGAFTLAVQLGDRAAGGKREATFVLSPASASARIERFASVGAARPEVASTSDAVATASPSSAKSKGKSKQSKLPSKQSPDAASDSESRPTTRTSEAASRPRRVAAASSDDEVAETRPAPTPPAPAGAPRVFGVQDLPARATKRVAPSYPASARAANIQGTVTVRVVIDEDGKVVDASALTGPSPLRAEAERAAARWTFRPLELEGRAVRAAGELSFRFTK